jgi:ribosomal protein L40E
VTPVVCLNCGTENEEQELFCRSCGAFLEWSGRRVEPAPAAVTDAEAGGDDPEATVSVVVATDEPPVGPVEPTREYVPAPAGAHDELPPAPGDRVCPNCSAGNVPAVRFCRRCGATLDGVRPLPIPWWQRLLGRGRTLPAGARPWPGRRRRLARTGGDIARAILKAFAVAAVVAALVIGVLWAWNSKVEDAVRHAYRGARLTIWPEYDAVPAVPPRNANAAGWLPGHGPRAAFDKNWNTFWVARDPYPKRKNRLTAGFHPARDVDKVGFFGGDPTATLLVPKVVQLTFYRWNSKHETWYIVKPQPTWRLANKPGFQRFKLKGGRFHDVGRVVLTIRSVYVGAAKRVAMTEVEFFDKR